MIEFNAVAILILISLFALWKLELAASLLNLKAFPSRVPELLRGWMDEDQLARARAYLVTNTRFDWLQSVFSMVLLLSFWLLGGFAWLDGFSRALPGGELAAGLWFFGLLFLAQTLLALPFSAYSTFGIEERFGFNRSTPRTFVSDQVKGLLLAAILGLPLAAAVLWIFGNVSQAWLWAWIFVTAFQLAVVYLAPSLILPLFNKFTPMEPGELRDGIEDLGRRCGFPVEGVFVIDGSKRSTKANAYFTGLGKRKKIALFDTLIEKHDRSELLSVLAHEIGHFRCGHIRQRLAVGVVQMGVIFFLLGLATAPDGAFARMLFDAFGVATISPQVGIVLFALLMRPVGAALGVMANAWSRKHEFEADAYAADVVDGGAEALGRALKKLNADHLSHPDPAPLRVWLDYSHPPLAVRLAALSRDSASSPA